MNIEKILNMKMISKFGVETNLDFNDAVNDLNSEFNSKLARKLSKIHDNYYFTLYDTRYRIYLESELCINILHPSASSLKICFDPDLFNKDINYHFMQAVDGAKLGLKCNNESVVVDIENKAIEFKIDGEVIETIDYTIDPCDIFPDLKLKVQSEFISMTVIPSYDNMETMLKDGVIELINNQPLATTSEKIRNETLHLKVPNKDYVYDVNLSEMIIEVTSNPTGLLIQTLFDKYQLTYTDMTIRNS